MKLNSAAVTHRMGDTQVLVSTRSDLFSGMVRSNETAARIVDCLKAETTKDAIVETLLAQYDAPRAVIEQDVEGVLDKLRSIGMLDE